jgi:hypothetical protein
MSSKDNGSVNLQKHCPKLWALAQATQGQGVVTVPPDVLREVDAVFSKALVESVLRERERQVASASSFLNMVVR